MSMNSQQTTTDLSTRQSAQGRNQSEIYVIYEKPADFPSSYVVRQFKMQAPVGEAILAPTLEEARLKVPRGRVNVRRMSGDLPTIVEVWQ